MSKFYWEMIQDSISDLTLVVYDVEGDSRKIVYLNSGYEYGGNISADIAALEDGADPSELDGNYLDDEDMCPENPTDIYSWFPAETEGQDWEVISDNAGLSCLERIADEVWDEDDED